MVVEPYANVPYPKSKSKLGVQYPKNMVPVKPLREMEDPMLGNSPLKQEMRDIEEEHHSEDRKEAQVLENVENPQMFDNQAAVGVTNSSTSGQNNGEQTATVENPVLEENHLENQVEDAQEDSEAPDQE